jgi:type I restriction enzyme, S subunit
MKLRPYPSYKDSGVQWIREIPENWDVWRIKDKLKFAIGGTPSTGREEYFDGDNLWVSIADMNNNLIISETKNMISQEGIINSNVKKVPKGSLLFSFKLSVGYVSFAGQDLYTNEAIASFLPNKNVNLNFLRYVLIQDFEQNGFENIYGAKLFNKDLIGFAKFVLPETMGEQEKISLFLDSKISQLDQTIEKDKELIELLKEKRTALINHVVTKGLDKNIKMIDSGIDFIGMIPKHWKIKKLKQVSDVNISNIDKKTKDNEPEVLLCNYVDVYNNEFINAGLEFMKASASIDQIKKMSLQKGDVIITKDSETAEDIAVPALVENDLKGVVCGYHLSIIKPNTEIVLGEFLFREFQSKKINDQFYIAANGVTRFGISTYPIKNSYVLIPPIEEQKIISSYIKKQTKKIDQTIDHINKKITHFEEYKKSLIHHVVTGKVDVREVAV